MGVSEIAIASVAQPRSDRSGPVRVIRARSAAAALVASARAARARRVASRLGGARACFTLDNEATAAIAAGFCVSLTSRSAAFASLDAARACSHVNITTPSRKNANK